MILGMGRQQISIGIDNMSESLEQRALHGKVKAAMRAKEQP